MGFTRNVPPNMLMNLRKTELADETSKKGSSEKEPIKAEPETEVEGKVANIRAILKDIGEDEKESILESLIAEGF